MARADAREISGVLNLNKSTGMTSHDVVDVVRRLYHIRKVGHTGTLDPRGTGVLPICVGRATKIAQFLTSADKNWAIFVAKAFQGGGHKNAAGCTVVGSLPEVRERIFQEVRRHFTRTGDECSDGKG